MKAIKCSLLVAVLAGSLSCDLKAIDKETSIIGTVQINTGEPVANYPISVVATKGSIYGGSNLVSRQDFHTDQNGAFSYQSLFKSGGLDGLGYELQWALDFRIQGQSYTVDTIQATIPGAGINVAPGYKFNGYLFPGRQHTLKIILKKN